MGVGFTETVCLPSAPRAAARAFQVLLEVFLILTRRSGCPWFPLMWGRASGTAGTIGRLIILSDGENGVDGFY